MSKQDISLEVSLPTVRKVAKETSLHDLVASYISAMKADGACKQRSHPFYLTDVGRIITLYDTWHKNLHSVHPFYAVKVNTDPILLSTLAALGCGFDCSSQAEIESILALGVPSERIIYANPFKEVSQLVYAATNNVLQVVFDTEAELHKISTHFRNAHLVMRIVCDDPSAIYKLGSKFGCTVDEAEQLLKVARKMGLTVIGVCFHIGSGSQNPQVYHTALKMSHEVFKIGQSLGYSFTLLDIGGGFPGNTDSLDVFARYCEVIKSGLEEFFSGQPNLRVIAEPGRYFSASLSTLAVCVIGKRVVAQSRRPPSFMYIINDGIYGAFSVLLHEPCTLVPNILIAANASSPAESKPIAVSHYPSTLFGPTCDSIDKICTISLPELYIGDWLYYKDMGAYTESCSTTFNGFARPTTYYFVHEECISRLMELFSSKT